MRSDVFVADAVGKNFGRKSVLRDVSLELAAGECTVLLGRNGAGKSTLLRLALGVLRPTTGRLIIAGADPTEQPDVVRSRIGYVPDTPDVPRWMRMPDLMRFARAHYETWNDGLAAQLIEQLDVPVHTRLGDLSRGQGMKAMMVLALAVEPELLLLDEPFAGLDPVVRDDVLRAVIGSLRQGQRTVLCATHELDVAARLADRVAVLEGGRIATHGTLAEVLGDEDPVAVPENLRKTMVACAAGGEA